MQIDRFSSVKITFFPLVLHLTRPLPPPTTPITILINSAYFLYSYMYGFANIKLCLRLKIYSGDKIFLAKNQLAWPREEGDRAGAQVPNIYVTPTSTPSPLENLQIVPKKFSLPKKSLAMPLVEEMKLTIVLDACPINWYRTSLLT